MAEVVVDLLEAVEVQVEDRYLPAVTWRCVDRLLDPVVEEQPVRQARQEVVLG